MDTDFKCKPIFLTPEELQEVFRTVKTTPELERRASSHG